VWVFKIVSILAQKAKSQRRNTPDDPESVERDSVLLALYARASFLPRWFINDIDRPK
jgi:hypothetical protein